MSDHAELMPLGVSHRLPLHPVGHNWRAQPPSTDSLEPPDVCGWVIWMDVEVHPILRVALLGDQLQDQDRSWRLTIGWGQDAVPISPVDQPIAESRLPEGHQEVGVQTVQNYRDAHAATLGGSESRAGVERQQVVNGFASDQHSWLAGS